MKYLILILVILISGVLSGGLLWLGVLVWCVWAVFIKLIKSLGGK